MCSDSAAATATAGDENSMVAQTSLDTGTKIGAQSGGGGIDGPPRHLIDSSVIDHQDGGAKRDSLLPCFIVFSVAYR